jgi:hypothetical protein
MARPRYKVDELQVLNTRAGTSCRQRNDVKKEKNMVGRVKVT